MKSEFASEAWLAGYRRAVCQCRCREAAAMLTGALLGIALGIVITILAFTSIIP